VEMFFQIFSALISSMTVVHSKNLYFGPLFFWHFRCFSSWLNDIQNNSDSIFITFPDQSYMSICCERFYNSKFFIWCFWYLKILELRSTSYMQIVLGWLVKLNFSLILSAFIFFLIIRNICLSLVLLILSILIGLILIIYNFSGLLYILFINLLRIFSFRSNIVHGCTFWIFIVVWMMHVAALRLINSFVWRLVLKLSLGSISNALNSVFTARFLILVSVWLLKLWTIIVCVYIFL